MQSKASTVAAYLASLPADRKAAIGAVRAVILKHLDKGYVEMMQYGMIGYCVPHTVYPPGYHCDPRQPLPFAGLASQKNHMSLYLMGVYCGCDGKGETELAHWFRAAWTGAGKKLDMGAMCVRFRKLEDVPLEVVGGAISRMPVKEYVEQYEKSLASIGKGPKRAAKVLSTTSAATAAPTAKGSETAKSRGPAPAKSHTAKTAKKRSTKAKGA